MPKAIIRLSWTKSPSTDIKSVRLDVNAGGIDTSVTYGPEVESHTLEVPALTNVNVTWTVTDNDGLTAQSVYSFVTSSLDKPLPVAGIAHEVLGVILDEEEVVV